MKDIRNTVFILPNLFTSANLIMGLLAITYVIRDEPNFKLASLAILAAMFFDVFDGLVARLTRTISRFGIEYDSLSDCVSFGVAPAIMMYMYRAKEYTHDDLPFLQFAFIAYAVFATLRLARFNSQVETTDSKNFSGIPTPAAAGAIISYFLVLKGKSSFLTDSLIYLHSLTIFDRWWLPLYSMFLGFLMISTIKFPAPAKSIVWKRHPFSLLVLLVALIAITVIFKEDSLFCLFNGYIFYGLIRWILQRLRIIKEKTPELA